MILYLLRHGIAAETSADESFNDDERPLSEEGRKKLTAATATYKKLMLPLDRIICSPLLRARQTAAILHEAIGSSVEIEQSSALHHSIPPTQILAQLQDDLYANVSAIALIGHQPHLGNLLGRLLSSTSRLSMPLTMGMMAAVEVREAQAMTGRLLFCLSQREACKLA